jgi:hypothetical protein
MPIEGPIQELGLPDVFQLLDLGRKSGKLRVVSPTRNDDGVVWFEDGHVVHAALRSKPAQPLEPALSPRDLERKARARIETVVYELLNWTEGFFSFAEGPLPDASERVASVATESLLMESARRVDEWSRIAKIIPHLEVVPALAPPTSDEESLLDLLPHEWEVLGLVDGVRDLRGMADILRRPEFDTAKVVYGLVMTGVVEIVDASRGGRE